MSIVWIILVAIILFFSFLHLRESIKISKHDRDRRRYDREWQKSSNRVGDERTSGSKKSRNKETQPLSNGNSKNAVTHSHSTISAQGIRFGESILSDAMIQNEATKMVTLFSEQLEHKMKSFYENKNHLEFRYSVGSISISYNPYDDLWAKSSAFRDYNVR